MRLSTLAEGLDGSSDAPRIANGVTQRIIPLLLAGGGRTRRQCHALRCLGNFAAGWRTLDLSEGARSREQAGVFGPPIVMTANDCRFFARSQARKSGLTRPPCLNRHGGTLPWRSLLGRIFGPKRDPDAILLALAADQSSSTT